MRSDDRGNRIAPRTHLNAATSKYVQNPPQAKDKIRERKARFETINAEIMSAGGWVTSIPGDRYIDFEILPGNPLPDRIWASGYDVQPAGFGERILPHSVVEYFSRSADGTLELMTEGSTKPVSSRVTHAGIARVEKFFFDMETKTAR